MLSIVLINAQILTVYPGKPPLMMGREEGRGVAPYDDGPSDLIRTCSQIFENHILVQRLLFMS